MIHQDIVLDKLTALNANQDAKVQDIRARCGVGSLTTLQAALSWLEAHTDGPAPERGQKPAARLAVGRVVHLVVCGIGSPAAQVGKLAEQLETRYRWPAGHGCRFLLLGQVPPVQLAAVQTHHRPEWPRSGRITLTLDASLSPADVARLYQDARRAVVSGKVRPVAEKNRRLLEFAIDNQGLSIRQLMAAWNRYVATRPDLPAYSSPQNFHRDIAATARRLSAGAIPSWPVTA